MITINDINWLAGWLEGEGSFTIYKKGKYNQFRIEFSSSDLDIIKKTKMIMKSNQTIFLRKQGFTSLGTKKKPEYYMKVYGSLAIQWMMTLYTLMGVRRKAKIKEILDIWKSYIQNGSGICRKCKRELEVTVIKGGWNKGKRQTYCSYCRGKY